MFTPHLYPLGIQTFSEVREKGFMYVDKTDMIYRITHANYKYVFLSRPRRFGKSLLVSTLKSYFEGRKDLFQGLAMERLEKEWTAYPVLHFSLAGGKHMEKDALERYLDYILSVQEEVYGVSSTAPDFNIRLSNLIREAYKKTGKQVVVLIDEYDAPLLDVVHEDEHLGALRQVMRNFYSPLKDCDPYLRFVFMTGITKFSQLSIFSELNNINNISMLPEYAALCGITREEIVEQMHEDVEYLGRRMEMSYEQTMEALEDNYGGYRFCWPSSNVFNPFSLFKSLSLGKVALCCSDEETLDFLKGVMRRYGASSTNVIGRIEVVENSLYPQSARITSLTPFLYQTGCLTIKDYDKDIQLYTLDFPNKEIRVGLFEKELFDFYSSIQSKAI